MISKMMISRKIICFVSALLATTSLLAGPRDERRSIVVLGEEIVPKDSSERRFKNHLIAPKGEWQCGLSVMYADFSSSDSEYMLLLQGLNANASMLRLVPEAAYTYTKNHAIGVKFQYTNMRGMLDSVTADLLGNLSMPFENVSALSRAMSGSIYQRTYFGLDKQGRVGLFWDYILGYSRTKTQFSLDKPTSAYSIKQKYHIGFAPGIVYFPMNNVSIQAGICIADFSYNRVNAYEDGQIVGTRAAWKARASLNLLDLNFGITIHL